MSEGFLSVAEVARRLNIKRDTVYAYVSRGLLSRRKVVGRRESLFDPIEVERLAAHGRNSANRTSQALIIESALTTVVDEQPHYRGKAVCDLAVSHSYEAVASLLWGDGLAEDVVFESDPGTVDLLRNVAAALPERTLTLDLVRVLVAAAVTEDPLHLDLRREAVVQTGRRLLASVIEALPALSDVDPGIGRRAAGGGTPGIAARLWSRLSALPPSHEFVATLNAALVVTADHDIAARSTLVARIAASVRADLYSAVVAGMHASGGSVQGASTLAIESFLYALDARSSASQVIGDRLRQGHGLPGFGHRTYPHGDPRAALVLGLLRASVPGTGRLENVLELLDLQRRRGLPEPNMSFALAAIAYVAEMPRGAGDVISALGRMAGWIGHAIEQYESREEIPRQSSVYVGIPPEAALEAANMD